MALAIYLLVGIAPLSAEPFGQYFDADRARVQKLLNLRHRKQIEGDCKAKAKKLYTAVHFLRRRAYVKDCIEHSLVPLRRGLMGFSRPGAIKPTTVTCSLLLSQPCLPAGRFETQPCGLCLAVIFQRIDGSAISLVPEAAANPAEAPTA